jgi:hypothetical protein
MFLDIIHRPVLSKIIVLFIFQNNVSETEFCLRLQVKPTQLGPIDRAIKDKVLETESSLSLTDETKCRFWNLAYDLTIHLICLQNVILGSCDI